MRRLPLKRLALTRAHSRRAARRLIAFGFWLLMTIFVWDLARFSKDLFEAPVAGPEMGSVDLIAVLTGGQGRLREAVQLLLAGRGKELFISGTGGPGITAREILAANDLHESPAWMLEHITLDPESQSTRDNARQVREIIARRGVRSVLLVTSNYHMPRTLRLFRQELAASPALDVDLRPYPVESPNFSPAHWYKSFAGWQILLSEYFKTLPLRIA
jgi:uncharacterized SAM-binding protein YcdF (DUF218 family)